MAVQRTTVHFTCSNAGLASAMSPSALYREPIDTTMCCHRCYTLMPV